MQFTQMLRRLLHTIINANPWGGPVFMSNTDLTDAYMRVWIRPEDLPRVAFVVPTHPLDDDTLIGFHLSLLMLYVDISTYFFSAGETVAATCLSVGLASRTPSLSIIGWLLPLPRTSAWTSLDSVPLILSFYVFPSMMMWSLPFPPSEIRPGSLLLQ